MNKAQWRRAIIRRDQFCIVCGSSEALQAHHLITKGSRPDLRYNEDNGITLCWRCHHMIHNDVDFKAGVYDSHGLQDRIEKIIKESL